MSLIYQDIVDFLYDEARLLDEWKLLEWADLFTGEGTYQIPPLGSPDADPAQSIFYANDTNARLHERAARLLKKEAHVEYPHSNTIRNVHNVKVKDIQADVIHVVCNFTTYRTKREVVDQFIGRQEYELVLSDDQLMIQSKKVVLNLDSLRPHGKISLIL